MKPILLSSEGNCSLYNAPDTVAEALKWYCNNYIKYIGTDVEELCFCEEDFVNYMNNIVLSDERIVFVKSIGFISSREQLPTEFRTYPWFDF